jgi:translocator protein
VTTARKVSKASIAISISVMIALSGLGGAITQLGPWYQALKMPDWQPPGPAFGIIWTTIYVLSVIAAVLAWRDTVTPSDRSKLIVLFATNCLLNLMWSFLFFKLQRPDWALYQVGIFWLSILALIVFIWPRNKIAGGLLVPYLVWVAIASFLNLSIVQLNGPFS